MSREIKLRAWDKWDKKIIHDLYDEPGDIQVTDINGFLSDDSQYEFMQFTGLIGKNGVEVYEGDIIKWKETRFHTKEQEEKGVPMPKWYISEVVYEDGGFIVSSNQFRDTPLCCFFGDGMDAFKFDYKAEVIGNIYENPELLIQNQNK